MNPPTQYATDANLRARQRLWEHQQPYFDIVGWVLHIAGFDAPGSCRVLDVGCGNGAYLRAMRERGLDATGCDLSLGMLAAAAPHASLVNADVRALPFRPGAFDVVLAPHMLYHVADRVAAASEMRRVLAHGGQCVVVTNGKEHMQTLRTLVEAAVRNATPGWRMRNPATDAFSLDNGEAQLRQVFHSVECVRPSGVAPVVLRDPSIVADYVASVADHYQAETRRPWSEVVDEVRAGVAREIKENGVFTVRSDTGAFVCS